MKYLVTVEVEALSQRDAKKMFLSLGFKPKNVEKVSELRSLTQNRALHLWFTFVANALNESGYVMQDLVKVERSWTMESFKELIYKHYLLKKYGKKSTTKMTKEEMDKIFDDINLWLAEKYQIHVPFPCLESLMENYEK